MAFLLVLMILTLISNRCAYGKPTCNATQFVTEDISGKKSCVNCPECPSGHGLTPQCGSTIKYGKYFKCEACKEGDTYSTSKDITSCRPCGICSDHETQISKCTPLKNSKCNKSCKRGFYYSPVTFDCQECSWCCKGSDISPIKACQVSGIPFYKQCSADDGLYCKPKCMNEQFVYVDKSLNQTCINCPKCHVGQGLSPKCSSVITSQREAKCVTCIPGKTFSDVIDSSTCKQCSKCEVGKKIERVCNTTHDTLCGDCTHGFYNDAQTKNKVTCRECSYCCGDKVDVRVAECTSQGLPTARQCAYTERAVTKCHPKLKSSNKEVVMIIVIIAVFITVMVIIFVAVYYYFYKLRNGNIYKAIQIEQRPENMMEDVSGPICYGKENPSSNSTMSCINFTRSGVTVVCDVQEVGKEILDNVSAEVCSDSNHCFPKLKEREVFLSPVIKLTPEGLHLQHPVRLHLFHSAHVEREEIQNWSITVLKSNSSENDSCTSDWTNVGDLKNIDIEKGWVEFDEDELGSYIVVGTPGRDEKFSKKRMCCAVFAESEPRVNAPYSISLFLIDDCEPSFKRLEYEESNQGRQWMASLRLFRPDIHPKSSISFSIENISDGWTLTHHPKKFYSKDWLDSYKKIPKVEATFVHKEQFKRDFRCTFVLKLNDVQVVEIPILHYFAQYGAVEPVSSTGVQAEDSNTSQANTEYEPSFPTAQTTDLKELLKGDIGKVDAIALAQKLFPEITDTDIDLIRTSANPIQSLSDMVKRRNMKITPDDLNSAFKEVDSSQDKPDGESMTHAYQNETDPINV